jgi:hypothetical protein
MRTCALKHDIPQSWNEFYHKAALHAGICNQTINKMAKSFGFVNY